MNFEEPRLQAEAQAVRLRDELDQVKGRLDLVETTNIVTREALERAKNKSNEKQKEISRLERESDKVQQIAEDESSKVAQLVSEVASLKQTQEKKITDLRTAASEAQQDLEQANEADRFSFEEQLEAQNQRIEHLAATVSWLESEKRKFLDEQRADLLAQQERLQHLEAEHEQALSAGTEQVRGFLRFARS